MMTDIDLRYFNHDELKCKGSGNLRLARGFGAWIDEIRDRWGRPLIVTSCCRSYEHNKGIGGHPNSYHIFNHPNRDFATCAIDFAMDARDRHSFVSMLMKYFGQEATIGVAKTFIHVDRSTAYTGRDPRLFTY